MSNTYSIEQKSWLTLHSISFQRINRVCFSLSNKRNKKEIKLQIYTRIQQTKLEYKRLIKDIMINLQ